MLQVDLSFHHADADRDIELSDVRTIEIRDHVFTNKLHAERAMIVDGKAAFELSLVSDLRLVVRIGA
jgi:hypothetical protein